MTKRLKEMRGAELVHTDLIHNQLGVVALSGGSMRSGHFEMFRNIINRKMDTNKVFAVWRVDPPWKPVTRHGQGKKLGGGKGAISFYETPIKRGRIILELGGQIEPHYAYKILIDLAQKLPFPAQVVSNDTLKQWRDEENYVKSNNLNKLTWEWCLKNNILNVINYVGKYDLEFCHLGPDCR